MITKTLLLYCISPIRRNHRKLCHTGNTYCAIEFAELASDIESTITIDDLVRNYTDSIRAAVDKHATVQTKFISDIHRSYILLKRTNVKPNVCGIVAEN